MNRVQKLCDDMTDAMNSVNLVINKKKVSLATFYSMTEIGKMLIKKKRARTSIADCKDICESYGFNVEASNNVSGWDISL